MLLGEKLPKMRMDSRTNLVLNKTTKDEMLLSLNLSIVTDLADLV